ncbi:exopolyphosphatase [Pedobacter alpinus]|uniref:Exopolyphosphatase n=1 Tax=Pedobacter alpinus TaxID=1590643 RepID=A0ABW5TWH3_9SPHI
MTKQKAVIDIGTNTFHLLIANVDEQQNIDIIHKNTIAVKLGEGGVNKGHIADAAYKRGIDALVLFRKELSKHNIKEVKATATAAVRDASNGKEFIAEALEKAQIQITIIDGLKEAEYIYNGAKGAGVLNDKTSLIMDIGGGSVEFIICNQNQIFWKQSYQLGAARLLADYYQHENAIEKSTLENIHQHFSNTLINLFEAVKTQHPKKLIGTAGSFDSFATIIALKQQVLFNPETMKSFELNYPEIMNLLDEIIESTHQQRLAMQGLIPLRTDMILMAAILTQFIIKRTHIEEVITCTYSLKEGLILSDH